MWHFEPPLRDKRHAVEHVLGLPANWAKLAGFVAAGWVALA